MPNIILKIIKNCDIKYCENKHSHDQVNFDYCVHRGLKLTSYHSKFRSGIIIEYFKNDFF